MDTRERIDKLRSIAKEIFQEILPGFKGEIVYLTQGKKLSQSIPMVEFALEIRKAFADRRKKKTLPESMKDLFISNSVNLATRIRVDVMKAIAKKISNDKELAYVAGIMSRPMMHIRKAGPPTKDRPLKSYNFIKSVSRFGKRLDEFDLGCAYSRAGTAFAGQLSQNFVVLKEEQNRTHDTFFATRGKPGNRGYGAGPSWRGHRGERSAGPSVGPPRTNSKKRHGEENLCKSAAKR